MRAQEIKKRLTKVLLKYRKENGYDGYPQLRMNGAQIRKGTGTVNPGGLSSKEKIQEIIDYMKEDLEATCTSYGMEEIKDSWRGPGYQIRFYYNQTE